MHLLEVFYGDLEYLLPSTFSRYNVMLSIQLLCPCSILDCIYYFSSLNLLTNLLFKTFGCLFIHNPCFSLILRMLIFLVVISFTILVFSLILKTLIFFVQYLDPLGNFYYYGYIHMSSSFYFNYFILY